MSKIVDVESYQAKEQYIPHSNIDHVLQINGLFRLDAFSYIPGDCLFDAFHVLLHFRYSSIELRNGLIDHFLACLQNGDLEAFQSYEYELATDFLYQLHGVHNVHTYLSRMRLSASPNLNINKRGLWGDTFCIRWLAKWLNIPVAVWSLTRKTRYLYFNKDANIDPYCILFHDANPVCGHYEPLLYKKLSTCNFEETNNYLSQMCKNLECHWNSIMHRMHSHGLRRAITNTSSCGDSLFVAICYLIATDFNVQSLRLYIVQSFCNAIKSSDPNAFHCLHRHLSCNSIHSSEMTNDWQEYLVKMAMPYHKGKIEGGPFCLQWISIIFNVNLQVWSSHCNNIVTHYSARSSCAETVYLLSFETDTFHVHYEPLIRENRNSICTGHCSQATMDVDNTHAIDHRLVTDVSVTTDMTNNALPLEYTSDKHQHIYSLHGKDKMSLPNTAPTSNMACHKKITHATQKHELSCRKVKQMIRENNKCDDKFPIRHGLKKHVYEHHTNPIDPTMPLTKRTRLTYPTLEHTPSCTDIEHMKAIKNTSTMHVHVTKNASQETYLKKLQDTPKNTCAICEQLHFSHNIRCFTEDLQEEYLILTTTKKRFSSKKICLPCKRAIENGKLPKFATPEQIRRNMPLPMVKELSELEERLVSLRIAFAQIRQWGYKRSQMGLTGSIINVPVHMDVVQKALPQFMDETLTIAVALKRRLHYKNAYQTGKVRVNIVMRALKELCSRSLYKDENISINKQWSVVLEQYNHTCIDNENSDYGSDMDIESDNERPTETLVHGFIESQRIYDLQDKLIEVAPAEGKRPLGIFKDKFAEEMNFPTLFYGDPRDDDIVKRFSYLQIVKWELLHASGDFSYHTTNLFFKTMRILIEKVLSCIWIRIRKGQLRGRTLLARDVKYKPNLEKILKSDIGYVDFKNIRISPDYLHQIQKNIFAMIRQLGPPTFFVTFTSAEHQWTPLVSTLIELYTNRGKQKCTQTLEDIDIDYLIRKDPVTCTRYYRHRINALKHLICHDETFFGKVVDYYFVTEFQNRGSEHEHGLLWIEDAPIYGRDNNSEIENFLDKYITCDTDHLDPALAKFHRHYHTRSCKKRRNSHCRYNFPMPPMKRTIVLEPISSLDKDLADKSRSMFTSLEQKNYDSEMTFEDFLVEMDLAEDQYIQLIQCKLKQPTIFLKRKPSHIWNNSFANDMPNLWNANTDAQYVLNAYAAASYCSSYMTKVDKSMTNAFRRIRKEHERSEIDAIQMIRTLGNTLLNLQQMSAQQAVHIALSLPLNCSSRECIFINTSPIDKRTFMLKPPFLLKQEPDTSEDVMCQSIIDYYIQRPHTISNICLAEFVSKYKKNGTYISKRKKPNVIRFIKYNKHIDNENYCREKLLLYVPFEENEHTLKHDLPTWKAAYSFHANTIQINEAKFTYNINPTWGDLENAIEQLHNNPMDIDDTFTEQEPTKVHCEQYDLQEDLKCPRESNLKKTINLGFQVTDHPFFLENEEYYRLRRLLNKEQQAIVKDIALKKSMDIQEPLYVFLTGGAGTGKTFTAKMLFQMLIRIYDAHNTIDPLKPKGLILAYTGKAAYNAGGTTIHSALLMPFNKSHFLPLSKEMLDKLSKLYQELQLVFIDEASLIGSRFLFSIDNRLRNIKHIQTKYFGNIDMIFCGDLYQAQPIQDSLIFEQPTMNMQTITYDFWKDNVKCYELHTTMRQTDEKFIAILNRMRTNSQTSNDLSYINTNCMRPAPNDPTFPYLFYKNKDVALHNKHMLSLMPGNELLINAIDEEEENHGNVPYHQHTTTLPSQLVIKLNMLVEIYACNYDSQDGLVNGADGIVKAYTKKDKLDVLWIKFYDPDIGHRQANKLRYLYTMEISKEWIPILRIEKPLSTTKNPTHLKIRKQFPIKLACARTIHRSQGLTLDSVAFDPAGIRIHGLVYTALSRVRNIESLYLLNPLKMDNFKVKQKIDTEMQRLRTIAKWNLAYDFESIKSSTNISILTLNTRSLHAHMNDILNDYDTMQSDILCLQETYMTLSMQNQQFPSFNCISSCTKHGVMTLVKKHLPILEHMHYEDQSVEVLIAKVAFHGSHLAIINIYAAPHATLSNIFNTITKALCHFHQHEILVILGDFNIDMSQCNEQTKKLENYMCTYNAHMLLGKTNHAQKTLIDHIWSNAKNENSRIYTLNTYWTDHDTICLLLEV
jgi:exonuclease III